MANQSKDGENNHKIARAIGSGLGWLLSKSVKGTYTVGKPVVKATGNLVYKGAKAATQSGARQIDKQLALWDEASVANWYKKAAITCEASVDALLNQRSGTSERVVRGLAAKLGAAGATAGIFSIASIFGTASTGTAISSLSGAAFNSAALKWIGGSMAVGGPIVALVGLTGGVVAYLLTRMLLRRITGSKRKPKQLDDQESRVVNVLLLLATSFRQQSAQSRQLDPVSASLLYREVFFVLVQELDTCIDKVSHWPKQPLKRLRKQVRRVHELTAFLGEVTERAGCEPGMVGMPRKADVISAVVLKLLSTHVPDLTAQEQAALEALRKTDGKLKNASVEVLRDYVCSFRIERIAEFTKRARGYYREMTKQSDQMQITQDYVVTIQENAHLPGVGVTITNYETGKVETTSLSGDKFASFVQRYNEAQGDAQILPMESGASSGTTATIANGSGEGGEGLIKIQTREQSDLVESMGVAGMVNLARNAGTLLRGEAISDKRKHQLIEDGVVTASVAGLTQLII